MKKSDVLDGQTYAEFYLHRNKATPRYEMDWKSIRWWASFLQPRSV